MQQKSGVPVNDGLRRWSIPDGRFVGSNGKRGPATVRGLHSLSGSAPAKKPVRQAARGVTVAKGCGRWRFAGTDRTGLCDRVRERCEELVSPASIELKSWRDGTPLDGNLCTVCGQSVPQFLAFIPAALGPSGERAGSRFVRGLSPARSPAPTPSRECCCRSPALAARRD